VWWIFLILQLFGFDVVHGIGNFVIIYNTSVENKKFIFGNITDVFFD
jgi:hypothetical protein